MKYVRSRFLGVCAGAAWLLASNLWPGHAMAEPFTPTSDAVVVERLPRAFMNAEARARDHQQRRLGASPAPEHRVALARQQFETAMAQGDPRYVGYAQGTLAPLDKQLDSSPGTAPSGYWLVRGMLQQYLHAFSDALKSLKLAQSDPESVAESLAWQAAIHMVRADYAAARQACTDLQPHSTPLFVAGCLAYVDATTGRTHAAYHSLSKALAAAGTHAPAGLAVWQHTRLAEMSIRLGNTRQAESHFRTALGTGVLDQFLLGAYADFLIDQQRPAEAIRLLEGWERSDVLLLRLALAGRALGDKRAEQWRSDLEARFAAAARRGDGLHEQEAARYELDLQQQAGRALEYAQRNFATQREPRDAWILLRAAQAAGQPDSARPALDWLRSSGFEDPRLAQLARSLGASGTAGGKP